eukprot:8406694-Pyramimonas_sp.AAC.1
MKAKLTWPTARRHQCRARAVANDAPEWGDTETCDAKVPTVSIIPLRFQRRILPALKRKQLSR